MTNWNTDRTPAEWAELAEQMRAESRRCTESAAESFERCDTDGFLSQWASGQMARKYDWAAELADNHGMWTMRAVFDAETGELFSTLQKDGQWGLYWVLNDAGAEKIGKRFVTESKASTKKAYLANNRKKGFTMGTIRVRHSGGVDLHDEGGPIYARIKAGDYEVVDTETVWDWLK